MIDLETHDDIEWVQWTPEERDSNHALAEGVSAFETCRIETPAGVAATAWLKEEAADAHPACKTWLLLHRGVIQGYYALMMGEVVLSSDHQKKLDVQRPRQGAVLIVWMGRAANPTLASVGDQLLAHALVMARRGAEHVGATVLALDPYDDETAEMWRKRGFKNARPTRENALPRMWNVLYPR